MDCMKCDIQKAHIQKLFHDPSAPNERYDSRCCWHLWQLWSDFTSPSATANLLSVRLCSACDGRTVPRCMRWNVRAVLWSVLVGKRMKAWWSSFPWFDLGTCNRVGSIMTKDLPSKNLTNILDCFIEHHGRIFISHWSLLCASKKKSDVFCWKKNNTPKISRRQTASPPGQWKMQSTPPNLCGLAITFGYCWWLKSYISWYSEYPHFFPLFTSVFFKTHPNWRLVGLKKTINRRHIRGMVGRNLLGVMQLQLRCGKGW